MKRFISRVSVTGADDQTDIDRLYALGRRFPFLEFAILFSDERAGSERYPTREWIYEFLESHGRPANPMALHLCGKSVSDYLSGSFENGLLLLVNQFDRVQLNFSQSRSRFELGALINATHCRPRVIIQEHGGNTGLLAALQAELVSRGMSPATFQLLFDCSGGRGLLPDTWPRPVDKVSCGYAGGQSPDNLAVLLPQLARAAGRRRVWIDAETGLRTDGRYDLDKVERFALIAEPYVVRPRAAR